MIMTTCTFASQANGPWILITQGSINRQEIPNGILLLELDAVLMTNLDGLYREFTAVFEFPDYFGKNFNALSECITDLEWLPANGYLLVIRNSGYLLSKESSDCLIGLLSVLNSAGEEWATPVKQGEAWDRDEVPFHTVLELKKDDAPDFILRLKNLGFEIGKI
jgi:RNAse (barnase) inhibitor barstar